MTFRLKNSNRNSLLKRRHSSTSSDVSFELIECEEVISTYRKCALILLEQYSDQIAQVVKGRYDMTNYRFYFTADNNEVLNVSIPLGSILDMKVENLERDALFGIKIVTKVFSGYFFGFKVQKHVEDLLGSIHSALMKPPLEKLAFSSFLLYEVKLDDIFLYKPNKTNDKPLFKEQWGVISDKLPQDETELNEFIVPTILLKESNRFFKSVIKLRRGRIPFYTWGSWDSQSEMFGNVLLRSYRPVFDEHGRLEPLRSLEDTLLECYYITCNLNNKKDMRKLVVYDTSTPDSLLQKTHKPYCNYEFLVLDNTEVIRAFEDLEKDINFYTKIVNPQFLKNAHWDRIVFDFINLANKISQSLKTRSVILQAPHGSWSDYVLSSLVQIIVDPHYRTISGLCELIDKDWIYFEFPFVSESYNKSVFFFLFLNCVWLIMQHKGHCFEFNEDLLLFLFDSLHDSRFNNFLFDQKSDLIDAIRESGVNNTIWDFIMEESQISKYKNNFFKPFNGVLEEKYKIFNWKKYFFRNHPSTLISHADLKRLEDFQISYIDRKDLYFLTREEILRFPKDEDSLTIRASKISYLPNSIGELSGLSHMSLNYNEIENINDIIIQNLTNLESLSFVHNKISYLSPCISSLQKLRKLNISYNPIEKLPTTLGYLTSLVELNIEKCSLSTIPPQIHELNSLVYLNISKNKITTFPNFLFRGLSQLKTLNLSTNNIKIVERLQDLKSLTSLDLKENKIKKLSSEIGYCTNLEYLDMSENLLYKISSRIGKCVSLTDLRLKKNELYHLPRNLSNCTKLVNINLASNYLEKIPNLMMCRKLKKLFLKSNKLKEIPYCVTLTPLELLDISTNEIEHLPLFAAYLQDNIQNFNVSENPVYSFDSNKAMKEQILLKSSDVDKIFEMNMLFVGEDSNKSRLIDLLIGDRWILKNEAVHSNFKKKTVQIRASLEKKKISRGFFNKSSGKETEKIDVHLWDFDVGVNNPTLDFLISKQSVVLIVFDLTDPKPRVILSWISSILMKVDNPSVILVGTQHDMVEDPDLITKEVLEFLQDKVNIDYHFINVSYSSNIARQYNISELKSLITEVLFGHRFLDIDQPANHILLEQGLLEFRKEMVIPIISHSQFTEFCKAYGITTLREINLCLKNLNIKGKILSVQNDPQLKDTIVLDPVWITDMITSITNSEYEWSKRGVLVNTELDKIWSDYPDENFQDKFLLLMQKFEFSFCLSENVVKEIMLALEYDYSQFSTSFYMRKTKDVGSIALVPSMLPPVRPHKFNHFLNKYLANATSELQREYEFIFLPQTFFSRLIVKSLTIGTVHLLWELGILFTVGDVYVLMENTGNSIEINVKYNEADDLVGELVFIQLANTIETMCELSNLNFVSYCNVLEEKGKKNRIRISELFTLVLEGKEPEIPYNLSKIAPEISVVSDVFEFINIEDVEIEKSIGLGGYAEVYKGSWRTRSVAVKKLFDVSKEAFKDFHHEINIYKNLDHECVAPIFAICLKPFSLVLELAKHGNLFDVIQNFSIDLPWPLVTKMSLDIARGLQYMHERDVPIAHRDIKSPNILVYSLDHEDLVCVKLTDFGTSQYITGPLYGKVVDNPTWLAPEILMDLPYGTKADTYAFGFVVWELATRKVPFENFDFFSDITDAILSGERPEIPKYCPDNMKSLLERCWEASPDDRPEWDIIISDLIDLDLKAVSTEASIGPSLKKEWKRKYILQVINEEHEKWIEENENFAKTMRMDIGGLTGGCLTNRVLEHFQESYIYKEWETIYLRYHNSNYMRFYLDVITFNRCETVGSYAEYIANKYLDTLDFQDETIVSMISKAISKGNYMNFMFDPLIEPIEQRLIHDCSIFVSTKYPLQFPNLLPELKHPQESKSLMLSNSQFYRYLEQQFSPTVLEIYKEIFKMETDHFANLRLFKEALVGIIESILSHIDVFLILGITEELVMRAKTNIEINPTKVLDDINTPFSHLLDYLYLEYIKRNPELKPAEASPTETKWTVFSKRKSRNIKGDGSRIGSARQVRSRAGLRKRFTSLAITEETTSETRSSED
eukprot:TRINITY_DN2902_c0_g1_i2.p1 TRINITY_DN2902_c0_g1~~TRINITY_DN2902_c0_g1_i2.p1  ORF type:complete len:2061 (-),score=333.79 TRINITY_DN2902_c0_g1_i2:97-6237(-)